jgi:hypothetical protein
VCNRVKTETVGEKPPLCPSQILIPLVEPFLHSETLVTFLFFFYLVCEAIGTVATPGLLCQPRVIMKTIVEKQMECRLAGETCPSATFVHHKIPHDQTWV